MSLNFVYTWPKIYYKKKNCQAVFIEVIDHEAYLNSHGQV